MLVWISIVTTTQATCGIDEEDLDVEIPGIERSDSQAHKVKVQVKYLQFADSAKKGFTQNEVVSLSRAKGGLETIQSQTDLFEYVGVSAAVTAVSAGRRPRASAKSAADKQIDKRWAHLLA